MARALVAEDGGRGSLDCADAEAGNTTSPATRTHERRMYIFRDIHRPASREPSTARMIGDSAIGTIA